MDVAAILYEIPYYNMANRLAEPQRCITIPDVTFANEVLSDTNLNQHPVS